MTALLADDWALWSFSGVSDILQSASEWKLFIQKSMLPLSATRDNEFRRDTKVAHTRVECRRGARTECRSRNRVECRRGNRAGCKRGNRAEWHQGWQKAWNRSRSRNGTWFRLTVRIDTLTTFFYLMVWVKKAVDWCIQTFTLIRYTEQMQIDKDKTNDI